MGRKPPKVHGGPYGGSGVGSLLVQNAKLGKAGAATKPCSRGLYDRGATSDSSLSRRRGWPGVLFILERRRRLFGDMTDGFGFGRADGGDQVGGEETP